MDFFDTHCHLDFDRFDADRDQVVARAADASVTRILVPAVDLDNCPAVLALADRYPGIYAAVGVHPNHSAGWRDEWIDALRDFARHEKVVAVGEIGLDYHWDTSPVATQKRALRAQLALADELELPVIIHNRESSADLIDLLRDSPVANKERPGVLHSFSAPVETAAAALDLGFYLGFTGPVTFKKAGDLRAVAAGVPRDRLLIETDAPFLAPQSHRGRRNEPAYVVEVAQRLAELHDTSPAEMAALTTANACRLFDLPLRP